MDAKASTSWTSTPSTWCTVSMAARLTRYLDMVKRDTQARPVRKAVWRPRRALRMIRGIGITGMSIWRTRSFP